MNLEDIRLREQLQRAVRSQEAPPYLEARIRASLAASRTQGGASWWSPRWAALGLAAAGLMGVAIAYQLGHLRLTTASQEDYVTSLSHGVATIMRVGLGDHLHCSYFRKYPQNPPKMEEFVAKLGPEYSGLIPVVRKQVPEEYRLELAHKCRYRGRQFVHLSLKDDKQLMSLIIAAKEPGEAFEVEGMLPALIQSGQPIYRASAQRFQIASFETSKHLVYFISDFNAEQNTGYLLAMAPAVKDLLGKLEL
jgi:hypothetical protein